MGYQGYKWGLSGVYTCIDAVHCIVSIKIKIQFCQGIESASSPELYSLDVQYFRRTVFPRDLGPGGTVFPKGIRSPGPKIAPDRIPYDTGSFFIFMELKSVFMHQTSVGSWGFTPESQTPIRERSGA